MTTSGTIKVMFSLIKNIKGEKPMSGFTTNLDLAYKVNPNTKAQSPYKMNRAKKKQKYNPPLFASVNNCSATRRSVAFADVFAEFTLSAITASPGID